MKLQHGILLVLGLALAGLVYAEEGQGQQGPGRGRGPHRGDGQGEEGMRRPMHPPPPLIRALDTNRDHEISAEEIENAAESLKTLDKNGDGKLTREELAPHRPPMGEGDGEGPQRPMRGPRGPGQGGPGQRGGGQGGAPQFQGNF